MVWMFALFVVGILVGAFLRGLGLLRRHTPRPGPRSPSRRVRCCTSPVSGRDRVVRSRRRCAASRRARGGWSRGAPHAGGVGRDLADQRLLNTVSARRAVARGILRYEAGRQYGGAGASSAALRAWVLPRKRPARLVGSGGPVIAWPAIAGLPPFRRPASQGRALPSLAPGADRGAIRPPAARTCRPPPWHNRPNGTGHLRRCLFAGPKGAVPILLGSLLPARCPGMRVSRPSAVRPVGPLCPGHGPRPGSRGGRWGRRRSSS